MAQNNLYAKEAYFMVAKERRFSHKSRGSNQIMLNAAHRWVISMNREEASPDSMGFSAQEIPLIGILHWVPISLI